MDKNNANFILYHLITTLSTFQEHDQRYGPDLKRDEKFAGLVIEVAKKLADLKAKTQTSSVK